MQSNNDKWYENESFWKDIQPLIIGEEHWNRSKGEVNAIISLLELKYDYRILDLCCGPGRHSLELASRGFTVTGVDRTKLYIREARKKASDMELDVEFLIEDMREFCRPGSYDVAINMYSSFGFFDDPQDDRKVILNLYQSLRNRGILLIDILGKEIIASKFRKKNWIEADNSFLLEEVNIKDDWSRVETRWIIFKGKSRKEYRFSLRIYSGKEIKELLNSCGFQEVRLYGNLDGSLYNEKSSRLYVVAQK